MTFLFLLDISDFSLCCGKTPHPDQAPGTSWRIEGMHSLWQGLRRVTSKNLGTWATVSWTRLVSIISDFCHWWVRIIAYVTEDHEWELSLFDWGWGVGNSSSKHIYSNGKRGRQGRSFTSSCKFEIKPCAFASRHQSFFPNGQEPFAFPYLWAVSSVMLDGMWTWVGTWVPWGFGNTISECAWWQCFQKR